MKRCVSLPLTLWLFACGAQPPGPAEPGPRLPAPPSQAPASSAASAASAAPPGPAGAPAAEPSLRVVYHGPEPWGLKVLGGSLYRTTKGGRDVYRGEGRWEKDDFVSGFPSLDVAGQWPNHLYASVPGTPPRIFEWQGQHWRPTTLRYAEQLQPWVDGSVIARFVRQRGAPDAFVAYGGRAPVPKPSRRSPQRFDCPHRLDIHGYLADPSGELLLWGTDCKEASNLPDDYFLERFHRDGRHEQVQFPEPSPLRWSDAFDGWPPVLARGVDDLWAVGFKGKPSSGLVLAHYDGKTVRNEDMPFRTDRSTFGADLAAGEGGVIWWSFRPTPTGQPEVWSRAPDGRWARWQVPDLPGQREHEIYHYNYFQITPFGREVWFEATVGNLGLNDGHVVLVCDAPAGGP